MGCLPFMSPCPGVAVSWPPPPCCGCGVVSLPVAWPPCPWRGLCARAMVSVSVAWSLCPWHGLRVHGVVSVAVFSICCITLGFLASYLPMGVFTPENMPAERILLHGSCHRYRLYGSHALY